jgi:hypothetical protein
MAETRRPHYLQLRGAPGRREYSPVGFGRRARKRFQAKEKLFRAWDGAVRADGSNVLDWFTTEKLLWDRSRGVPGIEGLERVRDLMTYDLLYVGIARKSDTFDRLFRQGHKARMDILANEPQRYPGARVTDEIFLFPFRISPLLVQAFDPEHDFSEEDLTLEPDRKRILADAEKAFVSLLKPQYNIVTFNNYPKGTDGLYGTGIDRYGYVIGESIAFNTTHGRIKGARDLWGAISNEADFIFVDGDKVSFYVSGVDFPATASLRSRSQIRPRRKAQPERKLQFGARVLPGRDHVREGEARRLATVRAIFRVTTPRPRERLRIRP